MIIQYIHAPIYTGNFNSLGGASQNDIISFWIVMNFIAISIYIIRSLAWFVKKTNCSYFNYVIFDLEAMGDFDFKYIGGSFNTLFFIIVNGIAIIVSLIKLISQYL